MEKKKIIFLASTLDIGGTERAILNFIKALDKEKYDIYLMLNRKIGIYLDEVPEYVTVLNFNMSISKNILIRKMYNAFRLLYFTIKYYHKFYFAACFSTVIKSCNVLAKRFSKNNAIWIHNEYAKEKEEMLEFIKYINAKKYKKVVFVANKIKDDYLKAYKDSKQELFVMNNLIDYKMINNLLKKEIKVKKQKLTLLNVGRHEEDAKRLTMMLRVIARLLKEGYDFELWLVGDGPDYQMYLDLVKELNISSHVKFFGKQSNVFPFYKLADAVLLSSFREGNPVVYLEAKIVQKPIITTNVSDALLEVDGFGIVTEFDEESYYLGVKNFLDNGYKITKKFDPVAYDKDILKKLDKIIGG